ncbi:MAG TPA: ParB/RepB/Spo0J family partition protein [Terracidiphilus sp.]|nr:ParB/RepB/Spo0J family partition protein [Terracidiphilus sp.]
MDQPTRNGSWQPACDFSAIPITLIPITALYSEDTTRLSRNESQLRRLEEDFRRRLREYPGEHPVHTPLRVLKRGERFLIVAGNYRYFAALRIPLPDLPCQVLPHDLDGIRLFIEMHRDNALHEDYSPVEAARNILHVKDQLGCSQAEAGRLLGVENSSDVTKLLSVLKRIPPDLLDKIGEGDGKLPFSSAYKLTQLSDEGRIRELADKAMKGLLCRDRLVDAVDRILHGAKRQKKPKPLKLAFGNITLIVKGNAVQELRALHTKLADVLKKIEREGWGDDFLPGLMK